VKEVTDTTSFTLYNANKDSALSNSNLATAIPFTAKVYEKLLGTEQYPLQNPLLGRDHRATVKDNGDSTYTIQSMPAQSETSQLHSYLAYKGGLMATYYANKIGPVNAGNVQEVLKNEGLGVTSGSVNTKNRLRFTGLIRPSMTGLYSFSISGVTIATTTTEPSVLPALLSVDNMNIAIATNTAGSISLSANSFYDILIDLVLDSAAGATVTLNLQYYYTSWAAMPTDRMYVAFHTRGSPFAVTVAPAPTCAAASTKEAQSISLATAGQIAAFTIQARDQYGLTRSSKVTAAGVEAGTAAAGKSLFRSWVAVRMTEIKSALERLFASSIWVSRSPTQCSIS
jgi:hypothetical protein